MTWIPPKLSCKILWKYDVINLTIEMENTVEPTIRTATLSNRAPKYWNTHTHLFKSKVKIWRAVAGYALWVWDLNLTSNLSDLETFWITLQEWETILKSIALANQIYLISIRGWGCWWWVSNSIHSNTSGIKKLKIKTKSGALYNPTENGGIKLPYFKLFSCWFYLKSKRRTLF